MTATEPATWLERFLDVAHKLITITDIKLDFLLHVEYISIILLDLDFFVYVKTLTPSRLSCTPTN